MISVLLVDDHTIVRQGLRPLLEAAGDIEVVGEASSGEEALQQVALLHPTVTILDLLMPGMNGLEVAARVASHTHVLILSMHSSDAYVVAALRAGALGYVVKDASAQELITAIRAVSQGEYYLSKPFSEKGIHTYLSQSQAGSTDPFDLLTRREREVLRLAAQGQTAAGIAEHLGISPRTVEIHRANLMHKLELETTGDLVRYALRKGIISLDE
jgi:DNA-binding NarL/FixJ family response regulator